MLHSPANMITEYSLLTFCETGVRKLVEMLVLLEQHYETDKTVLAIAGQKAQAYQRYGLDQITDDLLDAELTVAVNVGMGATDPVTKLQRFMGALIGFGNVAKQNPPGLNLGEVLKEIMSLAGYQDGERFTLNQNPELVKLAQINKQLLQKLQILTVKEHDRHEGNVVKLHTAKMKALVDLVKADKEDKHQNLHLYAGHLMEREIQEDEQMHEKEMAEKQAAVQAQQTAQQGDQQLQLAKAKPNAAGA